jgi:hypothetical protein
MKNNVALKVVENNSLSSKDFTIQASGKMFHMVISGLYSNKPQSITREIWSNAFDAHAMVGKEDVPFEVTFPTTLNPTFSCRDYGPGIAHENMEGFYTVLGHSTKENTNKAVGKWGVGRMSPMSYTDTFSVVSRHNGMITFYSIQLGPDGSPCLHVLAPPMPTTEESGLEVSFPVKREDINSFQWAAKVVSYGFDVKPRIKNSKEAFPVINKVFEGKNFYLYKDDKLSGAYAQMGCVLYPIPQSYLPRYMHCVYKFDIGDLEVTASREALSFGPKDATAANIKALASKVSDELHADMQRKIDAMPNFIHACREAQKFNHFIPQGKSFVYNGVTLLRSIFLDNYTIDIHCTEKGYSAKTVGFGGDFKLDTAYDYTIYVQDMADKKGNVRASRRIAADLKPREKFIWVRVDTRDPKHVKELAQLQASLPFPVKMVKDLPDVGAVTGNRGKIMVSRIHEHNRIDKYDLQDADFQQGGYYLPMSNNEYDTDVVMVGHMLKKTLNVAEIIVVPKTLWKRFEANPKWKLVEPELSAIVSKEIATVTNLFSNQYSVWPYNQLTAFSETSGDLGVFAKRVKLTVSSDYMGLNKDQWVKLLQKYGHTVKINNDRVAHEHGMILKKYPMLKLYEPTYAKHLPLFRDYVNLIDNATKE